MNEEVHSASSYACLQIACGLIVLLNVLIVDPKCGRRVLHPYTSRISHTAKPHLPLPCRARVLLSSGRLTCPERPAVDFDTWHLEKLAGEWVMCSLLHNVEEKGRKN